MFLNIKNRESGKSYTWDIPLVSETVYPPPDFMLFNKTSGQPECMDYAHNSDTLIIHDFNKKERAFFVYFYDTDFDIADPPMYRLKKNVSKEIEINSLFKVYADSAFVLDQEGLYFIQSDTTSLSGFGIRIENDFYPRITSIRQLVAPLAYLSTKEETEKLLSSDNLRASFERFWLDLAKSEEGAKNMIKKYYDRIAEANRLFTNYKEGWKSDMGMIYTIIGPPDEVYRNEGKESWYYKNPGKNQIVVFNFLNLKNLFCDNHYMLIRDNQYKSFWFKAIDKWRKGIN
jgi:GWxTD domain-containing protein